MPSRDFTLAVVFTIHVCIIVFVADIVFIVKDKPHARFRRDGVNLIYTAPVLLGQALTGYTVEVHTLDGRILNVPINDIIK